MAESNPVKWHLRAYAHSVHPSHHVVQRPGGTDYLVTPHVYCVYICQGRVDQETRRGVATLSQAYARSGDEIGINLRLRAR